MFNQIVHPAFTTTTLFVGPSAQIYRGVILEASVMPAFPGGGLPSGTVVFDLNGRPFRTARLVNGHAQLFVSKASTIRKFLNTQDSSRSRLPSRPAPPRRRTSPRRCSKSLAKPSAVLAKGHR